MIGLATPHHDGSGLYVSDPSPQLGDVVTLRLRVPRSFVATSIWVRYAPDGEQSLVEARQDCSNEVETWWRADVEMRNPVMSYRFLIRRGNVIEWLTQRGLLWWEPTDATDFRLTTYAPPPEWSSKSTFYEIFPDRFARSQTPYSVPDWAIPASWDQPLATGLPERTRQLYHGDLDGVRSKLDHVTTLGADAIYLTPIFPAMSNHRYDASSFESVDALLGGDDALVRLTRAAHDRGIRVLCDFTSNHCGDSHDWFRAAQADQMAPEAAFFYFKKHPEDYATWLGVRRLPKFDHRNDELRRRLYEGPDSVFGRWLQKPFDIDGWRIDVANMSGRYEDIDLNRWIARAMRWTMFVTKPDAFLLAEHFFDATSDLAGDGWHGVMNYAGFARPVWQWLASAEHARTEPWFPVLAPVSGVLSYLTLREFMAAVPWRSTMNNFNLLDSHDTARFRSITGDPGATKAGVGMQFTLPGIPMIFAGDELGMEGTDADDSRKPMPWDRPDRWDAGLLSWYQTMIRLRRSSEALQEGGLRWVAATNESLSYLRESPNERVLVHVVRHSDDPITLEAQDLGVRSLESLVGAQAVVEDGKVQMPSDGPGFNAWRLHS